MRVELTEQERKALRVIALHWHDQFGAEMASKLVEGVNTPYNSDVTWKIEQGGFIFKARVDDSISSLFVGEACIIAITKSGESLTVWLQLGMVDSTYNPDSTYWNIQGEPVFENGELVFRH